MDTATDSAGRAMERRSGQERRKRTLKTYWQGARTPRRRSGRRTSDLHYPVIDWHSPRVLALVLGILGLSVLDGAFTIVLLSHGAVEINPVMARLLPHGLGWFAAGKLALTGAGLCVLVACSRMRLFRVLPGESILYLVLLCYAALILYETHLLEFAHEAS